jgi:hypothetical protein
VAESVGVIGGANWKLNALRTLVLFLDINELSERSSCLTPQANVVPDAPSWDHHHVALVRGDMPVGVLLVESQKF